MHSYSSRGVKSKFKIGALAESLTLKPHIKESKTVCRYCYEDHRNDECQKYRTINEEEDASREVVTDSLKWNV